MGQLQIPHHGPILILAPRFPLVHAYIQPRDDRHVNDAGVKRVPTEIRILGHKNRAIPRPSPLKTRKNAYELRNSGLWAMDF